jgi:hypothetical protein
MTEPPAPLEPRRSARIVLEAEITMRRAGFPNFTVQIDDISLQGCRIDFVDRPVLHERVWIKFDGLVALEGSVMWVKGHSAGIEFDQAIHPAVLDDLVGRLH